MKVRYAVLTFLLASLPGTGMAAGLGTYGSGFGSASGPTAASTLRHSSSHEIDMMGSEDLSLRLFVWGGSALHSQVDAASDLDGSLPREPRIAVTQVETGTRRFSIANGQPVEKLATAEAFSDEENLPAFLLTSSASTDAAAPTPYTGAAARPVPVAAPAPKSSPVVAIAQVAQVAKAAPVASAVKAAKAAPAAQAEPAAEVRVIPASEVPAGDLWFPLDRPGRDPMAVVPEEVLFHKEPDRRFVLDYSIGGTTLAGFESRSVPTTAANQKLIPVVQFLRLDLDKIRSENLSFHLYGWGKVDLGDHSSNSKSPDGNLSYAYFTYRFPSKSAELTAGRFTVYQGGKVEQLTGASVRADLFASGAVTVSAFGGAPVKTPGSANRGDFILGGRVGYRIPGLFEAGISLVRETGLVSGPDTGMKNLRQLAGFDLWYAPLRVLELTGHTSYNLASSNVAEQSYQLSYRPTADLLLAAEYQQDNLSDLFYSSSLRSLFNPSLGEKSTSYGARVSYSLLKPLEVVAEFKDLKRESRLDSYRFGGEIRLSLDGANYGVGWYRLAAGKPKFGFENLPVRSFNQFRAYALYRLNRWNFSLDGLADLYDSPLDNQRIAYSVTGSAGYSLRPDLGLSGDLSYDSNPVVGTELRGLVRLNYNFSGAHYTTSTKGVGK